MSKAYEGLSPCKDCEKRALGCHSTCEDYKKWKANGIEIVKYYTDYDTKRKRRLRRRR